MADRGQQRCPQIITLLEGIDFAGVGFELQPLVRQRRLAKQRCEQDALVRGNRVATARRGEPQHGMHPQRGFERVELPVAGGQRAAVAPGHLTTIERPFGCRDVERTERWRRRAPADANNRPAVPGQQHGSDVQQPRHFLAHRCRCSGFVGNRRQALPEGGKRGVLGRGARADGRLALEPPGQLAGDHRNHHQHQQCDDVLRIADRERVDRRQEEEVVGQRGCQAGNQRSAQAEQRRGGDHRQQIDDVDRVDADHRLHRHRARRRDRHHAKPCRDAPQRRWPTQRRFTVRRRLDRDRDHVDRHVFKFAHQSIDHRAVAHVEPPVAPRLADDDGGRARFEDVRAQPLEHRAGRDGRDRGAKARSEL